MEDVHCVVNLLFLIWEDLQVGLIVVFILIFVTTVLGQKVVEKYRHLIVFI